MRVLVTRPRSDSETLAAEIVRRGHEALIEPLLETEVLPWRPDALGTEMPAAVVVTSRAALAGFEGISLPEPLRVIPLFAVGPATADLARRLGFAGVVEGPGAAEGLPDTVVRHLGGVPGRLAVYLTSQEPSGPAGALIGNLQQLGFVVKTVATYRTRAASALSAKAVAALEEGRVDKVLLYSPRTARIYLALLQKHNLFNAMRGRDHLCLSAAVAAELAAAGLPRRTVAKAPSQKEMLALLDGAAPK